MGRQMSDPIYPSLIVDGIDQYAQHQAWLRSKGYTYDPRVDLTGVEPALLMRRGADLRCDDLRDAILSYANLYGVTLRHATMHGANLRGADLRGADMRGVTLRHATMHGANLRGADLRGADLLDTNLDRADLSSTVLFSGRTWGDR